MSIIRSPRRTHYTVVENVAIEDSSLSFRARGVLVWLLSKPDGWEVTSNVLAKEGSEGRDAILTALKELESAGYIARSRVRYPDGRFGWQTMVFETPQPENPQPEPGNPDGVQPPRAKPDSITSTELVSTEKKTHTRTVGKFDEFLHLYPRNIGKPRAAWNRLTVDEREQAMLALVAWVAFWKRENTEPNFIPYPGKWLRDRYWENPPVVPSPPGSQSPTVPPGYVWVPSIDKICRVAYLEDLGIDPTDADLIYGPAR